MTDVSTGEYRSKGTITPELGRQLMEIYRNFMEIYEILEILNFPPFLSPFFKVCNRPSRCRQFDSNIFRFATYGFRRIR